MKSILRLKNAVVFALILGLVSCSSKSSTLVYEPGEDVRLTFRAELFESIVADGKELITDGDSGELVVPILENPEVIVKLKEDRKDLSYIFSVCKSLKKIPSDLFAHNSEVTDFHCAFSGCLSLESIPEGLFAKNPEAIDFRNSFFGCSSLQSIPADLFANNSKVTGFYSTFSDCASLRSIPSDLFAHNPNVTSFVSTFNGCTSLKSIPEGLFAHNPIASNFISTFKNCTSLKFIPFALFDNNLHIKNIQSIFYNCTALTGESPYTIAIGRKTHLYERHLLPNQFVTPESFHGAFYGCVWLDDYEQMPEEWVKGNDILRFGTFW